MCFVNKIECRNSWLDFRITPYFIMQAVSQTECDLALSVLLSTTTTRHHSGQNAPRDSTTSFVH